MPALEDLLVAPKISSCVLGSTVWQRTIIFLRAFLLSHSCARTIWLAERLSLFNGVVGWLLFLGVLGDGVLVVLGALQPM